MVVLGIVLAMAVIALAIPYHAPTLGLFAGLAQLGVAALMIVRPPPALSLDFGLTRPIGLALALYATLWLLIAAVQLVRRSDPDPATTLA